MLEATCVRADQTISKKLQEFYDTLASEISRVDETFQAKDKELEKMNTKLEGLTVKEEEKIKTKTEPRRSTRRRKKNQAKTDLYYVQ
jgi:hypothetical protein